MNPPHVKVDIGWAMPTDDGMVLSTTGQITFASVPDRDTEQQERGRGRNEIDTGWRRSSGCHGDAGRHKVWA